MSQNKVKPGIERVQALADISHSALCCHSNETCSPIVNPTTSGHPLPFPQLTSRSMQ